MNEPKNIAMETKKNKTQGKKSSGLINILEIGIPRVRKLRNKMLALFENVINEKPVLNSILL